MRKNDIDAENFAFFHQQLEYAPPFSNYQKYNFILNGKKIAPFFGETQFQ